VFVAPLQIWDTVERLKSGADMVYPYDARFARVPRQAWFKNLEKTFDVGIFGDTVFQGMRDGDLPSVGGAVFFDRQSFFEGGGENENFFSYGPEDAERFERFTKLGFDVQRVPGALYHMDHFIGPDSSTKHKHINKNRTEWHKIQDMTKDQLAAYVAGWGWLKK
jgi:hypothetical protein